MTRLRKTPRCAAGRILPTAFLLAVSLGALLPAPVLARVDMPPSAIHAGQPVVEDPYRLVDVFLKAVERGELTVLGRALDRSMLIPTQVEYAFDLATGTTVLKIHADLREPLNLPGQPGYRIRCISAEIKGSRITAVESHVWLDE
jgi:hypothetical protein